MAPGMWRENGKESIVGMAEAPPIQSVGWQSRQQWIKQWWGENGQLTNYKAQILVSSSGTTCEAVHSTHKRAPKQSRTKGSMHLCLQPSTSFNFQMSDLFQGIRPSHVFGLARAQGNPW